MDENLKEAALEYHRLPRPGKISVVPTKAMATQRDLALAYSPGVAEPCLVIAKDPLQADVLTARSNLVAVVTNGTAVLGLGNIGALAGKPVMEGKACLFKKFAGIDVFDIELAEDDPDALIDTIARMEPTFGGINLEDIKAPECFYVEQKLRERMKIPVFHDDQHGTAIIVGAAMNHWYHMDMNYRGLINMLMLCGCVGQTGGGWAHYVGQEKLRPQCGWLPLAFGLDWNRPPRQMNGTSFFYAHSSQWRHEKMSMHDVLSPLADKSQFPEHALDYNIRAERAGWLPSAPQLNTNPLHICRDAAAAGMDPKDYVVKSLKVIAHCN